MGLDLMLVLSTARLYSLNLSLRRRLVSPIYCKITTVTLNHVEKIHSSRDSVRKAGESHLIDKATTLQLKVSTF